MFMSSALPQHLDVRIGEPAPFNIKAPKDFTDRPATERLRNEAMQDVPDVYEQDPGVEIRALNEFREFMGSVRDIRQEAMQEPDPETPTELQPLAALMEAMPTDLSEDELTVLLEAGREDLARAEALALDVLGRLFGQGIKAHSLEPFREQVMNTMIESDLPPGLREVMGKLCASILRPNLLFQAEETAQRKQMAAENVTPVTFVRGEVIVPDGKVIAAEDMVRLRDAGLIGDDTRWRLYGGSFLYALLALGLMAAYLYRIKTEIFESESRIVLTGMIITVVLFGCRFLLELSPFIMPVAAGTMLLGILLDEDTAIVAGLIMGLSVAVISGGNTAAVLVSLAGATVAAIAISEVEERTDIMRAGIGVAVVNGLVLLAFMQFVGGTTLDDPTLWKNTLWAVGNGVLSAVMAIGILPFLESFFGILTPVKLLELSNPNHPLLRQLLQDAPGTYHHSITVANLAESAVEAVEGDSLLARVGAYYHDVGKSRRPYFFVENQFAGDNPHDKMSPNLSALIVIAHVKDGLDMAEEYGLPSTITEFISEHHGTTRVEYFYSRAREMSEDEVPEDNYRYSGPCPQTKETAVVMLADAVEAAVRSLSRPTPDRIKGVIRRIIHDRFEDGQLDQCDLTFRDLDRVADSFTQVLSGAFHQRLQYPESVIDEIRDEHEEAENGAGGDGGSGNGTGS